MFKLNRKIVIIASSITLILVIVFSTTFVIYQNRINKPEILTDHEPIIILNDKDFKNYKFPGRGTENNPYLIQYYNITTDHSESIYISGTTKHFNIQNCYLNSYYTNIFIENSNGSVQIIENDIEGALQAINILNSPGLIMKYNNISIVPTITETEHTFRFNTEVVNCANSIISLNSFTNGSFTIIDSENVIIDKNEFYLKTSLSFDKESYNAIISENFFESENSLDVDSHNATISGNFFETEGQICINGLDATDATVSDNLFKSGGFIDVSGYYAPPNAKIIGNEFEDGGLIEIDSQNSIISNNQISNGGYGIYDASSTVENNLVNDKELGFFVNLEDEIFSNNSYGQLIFIECMNLTIRDLKIMNTSFGIFIASSNNITVLNNELSYDDEGIVAVDSYDLKITDNFMSYSGILLGGCENSSIANNIGYNSTIFVQGTFVTIENNTLINPEHWEKLSGHILSRASYGIGLQYGRYNVIQNNIIEYSEYGILCDTPQDSIFYNNTCNFVRIGISLWTDPFFIIYNVTVDNNSINATETSINLGACENITISNNVMNTGINIDYFWSFDTFNIVNNTINGRLLGFYVDAQNLVLSSPEFASLYLINCSNSVVSNQVINDKSTEIVLDGCDNTSIMNSSFTDSNGMYVYSSTNCLLKNNTHRNSILHIRYSSNCTSLNNSFRDSIDDGLLLAFSSNCLVSNNSFVNCSSGIHAITITNCTIKFNLVMLNREIGIHLYLGWDIENMTIHHNAFVDNGEYEGSQAVNYGLSTLFYDVNTLSGNYWSNWSGVGYYYISGDAGSYDPYPLASNPL